jgi:DNA invertase Pin-like site-specific DNA recombinase
MAKRRQKPAAGVLVVVGYVRCSTVGQDLSPAAQGAALDRWFDAEGASCLAVFFDIGISGGASIAERPGLAAALAFLGPNKVGALVAAKRDRLARDVGVAVSIEKEAAGAKARVLCADGANGEDDALRRGIDDLMSAEELRRIRRRTRDALAVKKARGEVTGQPRYGYRASHLLRDNPSVAPSLIVVESEQRCLARARELDAAGLSYAQIGKQLAAEGFFNREGRPWVKQRLCKLLGQNSV